MKKITLLFAALLLSTSLCRAEGYQVNTLSTRQLGMGHTGVALKLGAESMLFNPAGMAFMNKTLDIEAGVTGISATAKCNTGDKEYSTDNKISTPFFVHAAFSIYDNLKAGVAFYTPYGSSIDWSNNWPGATLAQKISLKTYIIQPTISWKILKNLSVGAGVTVAWGSVDLNKGLINPTSMDAVLAAMGNSYRFVDVTPASVNLKGTSQTAIGFNVGAMYDLNSKVTFGASFRSKMKMKVKSGDASVSYANKIAETLLQDKIGLINEANYSAEMPMPYVLTLGASYKPIDKLTLAFDAQLTGWSAYKSLDIVFASETLQDFNQHLEKNYKNAWAFRVGGQYALTSRLDVRAGLNFDMTPVDKNCYNPETPGMNKFSPSVGFSFRPFTRLSIDMSCAYVQGIGSENTTYTYTDMLLNKEVVFKGDYKTHAWCPSIGLGYSF